MEIDLNQHTSVEDATKALAVFDRQAKTVEFYGRVTITFDYKSGTVCMITHAVERKSRVGKPGGT